MNGLQLIGTFLIIIVMLALIGLGTYHIRKGVKTLPHAETLGQEPTWHKQPNILLGISNIIFALLVCLVAFLSIFPSARLLLFILIGLTFLASLFLVMRTASVTMQAARNLRERQTGKRS
jgi:hypothetical protein